MNRKCSIFTIIITILILVSGCSAQNKPETIVTNFIKAMKHFDAEGMALQVNPKDVNGQEQVYDLIEDEGDEFEKYFLEYIKSNAKKITYDLKDTKIDGDKATVNVDFKYVDGGPLLKATFAEYLKEALSMMFDSNQLTDDEISEMIITIMKEQSELIEVEYTEKSIGIKCIKLDDKWYIDDPSDELFDVAMSNMMSIGEEMNDTFNFDGSFDDSTTMDQVEEEDMIIIEKGVGDEITLGTIKLKVKKVEVLQTLTSTYGDPVTAKEDAKFLSVSLDITNITKSGFSMEPNIMLVDNQDREFNPYSDTMFAIDDYMDYRDLSPSIKEAGRFIYELPKDSTGYYLFIGKAGTNEVYKIILK